MNSAQQIATQLDLPFKQVAATIELLDAGNTLPFIARYRKEITGGHAQHQRQEYLLSKLISWLEVKPIALDYGHVSRPIYRLDKELGLSTGGKATCPRVSILCKLTTAPHASPIGVGYDDRVYTGWIICPNGDSGRVSAKHALHTRDCRRGPVVGIGVVVNVETQPVVYPLHLA